MGKIIKSTLVRKSSQGEKIKATRYSKIFGRNLIKKGDK